jgi:hypothetical protein
VEITRLEAAEMLDPAMTPNQAAALTIVAAIPVTGRRPHQHGRGHPSNLYDLDAIRQAHAEEAARTAKQFTDNDWIASALLARSMIRAVTGPGELWWPDGTRAERLTADLYGYVRAGPEMVHAHRVLWIAGEGEIPPGIQINHINRRRWDNRRANLELVTHGNNIRHWHGSPYITYHDAVRELAEPPDDPGMRPQKQNLDRAGGAFRRAGR